MLIDVSSVSKNYKNQKVLKDISFTAYEGEIIGFLGKNGAGKSTMMKILTGYIKPNSGNVSINKIDILKKPLVAQKTIGYLPEQNPLYSDMYVREYLYFQASIFKVNKTRVNNCIEKFDLQTEAHKKINKLSKGYRQRVGLAAAILHDPKVLILDEPTTGLDPNQLDKIRKLIKELAKNKTIILSTHIMQEVEAVCNRAIIINKGEIVLNKKLSDINKNNQQTIEVTFDNEIEENLITSLSSIISCKNISSTTWRIAFNNKEDMRSKIFDLARENDLKILNLNLENKSLETLFKEITT